MVPFTSHKVRVIQILILHIQSYWLTVQGRWCSLLIHILIYFTYLLYLRACLPWVAESTVQWCCFIEYIVCRVWNFVHVLNLFSHQSCWFKKYMVCRVQLWNWGSWRGTYKWSLLLYIYIYSDSDSHYLYSEKWAEICDCIFWMTDELPCNKYWAS